MKDINECTVINDETQKVRQGDIFSYLNSEGVEQYGIVITGDCDIDKGKCNNIISFCSIFTAKHHVETVILKKKINNQLDSLKQRITSQLKKIANDEKFSESSFESVMLLDSEGLQKYIPADCFNGNDKKRNKFIDEIDTYKKYYKNETFSFEDYKSIFLVTTGSQPNMNNLISEIKNSFKSLAGDLFYINDIPELDEKGFVVYLRYINTFPEQDFYVTNKGVKTLFRIARLNPPFIHSLTQHVGAMFSDIGLSKDYEDNREETIEKILVI